MIAEPEALKFGLYMALVGISITFGSLIFLYLILRLFGILERRGLKQEPGGLKSEEGLLEEEVAVAVIGIEKYLEEDRAYISAPSEIRLEYRKPSAWKLSGRSED